MTQDPGDFATQSFAAPQRRPESTIEGVVRTPLADTPEAIGPYKILEPLGEGGMGEVYLAEQTKPVRRRVALKIIKLGMDTKEVIARFESERQALAMMNHPNVAKVFDAGVTERGRPFFVMEHVPGVPITMYCDQHRLGLEARLALFLQICSAIQHAHQNGIIHRDIKPSNVLVSVEGDKAVPKVIDFGVAKATRQQLTERTVYTAQGQLIGTPEYMSPEQAEMTGLNVDTRTDIYSLGILLFELLAGSRPFDRRELRSKTLMELQHSIRDLELPMPSTRFSKMDADTISHVVRDRGSSRAAIFRELRGDLDWITMRAVEKDRTRRYDSADSLAADIRRHIEHQPVLAGPPSAVYRLKKFVRRNRALVIGMVAVGAALIAGTVASTIFAVGQSRARAEAERQASIAQAVNAFLNEDLLAAANPQKTNNPDITVKQVLDLASDKIANRFPGEPLIESAIRMTLGYTYLRLGQYELSEDHLEQSAGLRLAALGPSDPLTLQSQNDLAEAYWRQGRDQEAEPLYRQTLAQRRAVLGPTHEATLQSMNNLGLLYWGQGRHNEAEPLFDTALAGRQEVLGPDHEKTLVSMNNLALLYQDQQRYDEAEPLFRKTLRTQRRELGSDHPDTLNSMNNLALLYRKQRRYEEAESLYLEARERHRRVLGDDHPQTLICDYNLALVYVDQQRYDEADPLMAATAESARKALPGHWYTGVFLSGHGDCLRHLRQFDQAEQALLAAHTLLVDTLGPAHERTAGVIDQLIKLYGDWNQPDRGREWESRKTRAQSEANPK